MMVWCDACYQWLICLLRFDCLLCSLWLFYLELRFIVFRQTMNFISAVACLYLVLGSAIIHVCVSCEQNQ